MGPRSPRGPRTLRRLRTLWGPWVLRPHRVLGPYRVLGPLESSVFIGSWVLIWSCVMSPLRVLGPAFPICRYLITDNIKERILVNILWNCISCIKYADLPYYLKAKMFKIEKCISNYVCFKHSWVLEVMSLSVDINEKIVLWPWSPGSFFYFRAANFKNTFFFRTPTVNASEDCLNVDYSWKF